MLFKKKLRNIFTGESWDAEVEINLSASREDYSTAGIDVDEMSESLAEKEFMKFQNDAVFASMKKYCKENNRTITLDLTAESGHDLLPIILLDIASKIDNQVIIWGNSHNLITVDVYAELFGKEKYRVFENEEYAKRKGVVNDVYKQIECLTEFVYPPLTTGGEEKKHKKGITLRDSLNDERDVLVYNGWDLKECWLVEKLR